MASSKTKLRLLTQGTDMTVRESPSYIRITGPLSTVAYAHPRSDGSLRIMLRRPDGQYPDKVLVETDEDVPRARELMIAAELRLDAAKR